MKKNIIKCIGLASVLCFAAISSVQAETVVVSGQAKTCYRTAQGTVHCYYKTYPYYPPYPYYPYPPHKTYYYKNSHGMKKVCTPANGCHTVCPGGYC